MKKSTKANIYTFILFSVIFLIIWLLVRNLFKSLAIPIVGAITAAISVILAPQKRTVKTQSGEQIQLKWIFSKKVIIIK